MRWRTNWTPTRRRILALAWALAGYRFSRYKQDRYDDEAPQLVWPATCRRDEASYLAEATGLVRDLINTPAADMGPDGLAQAAQNLATKHSAAIALTIGDELLTNNFPAIHAVGRAHDRAPRLIDLMWGPADAPKVTLVGKGVCFDTGGLDIKSAAGMKLMKKDMGGAAHVLGAADALMESGLNIRLRVLVPAVENSISSNAMRPGDVVPTRKGLTIEIGNTDAEGRVILSDALAEAAAEKPELIVDFATLTGSARIALGTELPALFCNDDDLADGLLPPGRTPQTRSGACRFGPVTTRWSTARLETLIMPPRAAMAVPSQRRCSYNDLLMTTFPGLISILWPGT